MYCVVTGASSGFGTEFAYRFAERRYDLCLASRNIARLREIGADIESRFGVHVDVVRTDLTELKDMENLYRFTKGKDVDILVNNAGVLTGGLPDETDRETEAAMIDTNVKAVHYMTRLYLDDMLKKDSGKILNIASLSAWAPTPLIGAYGACKSFILSFSESLNYELGKMKSRVQVSVATPGFFNTGITGKAFRMIEQKRSLRRYTARVVRLFLGGKSVINLGLDKATALLVRLLPRFLVYGLSYNVIRMNLKKPEAG